MHRGFYAYPSSSSLLCETIESAIRSINEHKIAKIEGWQRTRIGGKIVIKEILSRIASSDIFLCDLTGLNPNVLFELGYAMALRKRAWITLDTTKHQSAEQYGALDILSGFGYRAHTNYENIVSQFLQDFSYFDLKEHLLKEHDSWIDSVLQGSMKNDVFYIPSSVETTTVKNLINYLASLKKHNKRKVVWHDRLENSFDPLRWHLRNILEANSVIAHLDDADSADAAVNNARCSLLAGIAYGFNKNVLLIAPDPFEAPFDYRSMLVPYKTARQCRKAVERWLTSVFMTRVETRKEADDPELALLAFHIGETTAENEEVELPDYFMRTAAYSAGTKSKGRVFVGRKGTGKTANLYQLREHFARDQSNIVVTIKPVSFRIAAYGRLIDDYFDRPELASDFIERTWRAIVYSEIAIPVLELIQRETRYREPTADEAAVIDHVNQHREFVEADFADRIDLIRLMVETEVDRGRSPKAALNEIAEDLTRPLLSAYLSMFRRYQQVVVLVDNLDKAWSVSEDRSVQTRIIFGLLDLWNTMAQELSSIKGEVRFLVFLREDIFNHVIADVNEPDKMRLALSHISWSDEEQLAEMLEKRFAACAPGLQGGEVWSELFCRNVDGMETKRYLLHHVMPRPRDLIHVVRTAIDNCVGRSRSRIEADDLKDALREYYQFLLENMFSEYGGYVPNIRDVVQAFAGGPTQLSGYQIWTTLVGKKAAARGFRETVEFLVRVSFLGMEIDGVAEFAYTSDDVRRLLPLVRRGLRWYELRGTRFVVHPAFYAGLGLDRKG